MPVCMRCIVQTAFLDVTLARLALERPQETHLQIQVYKMVVTTPMW